MSDQKKIFFNKQKEIYEKFIKPQPTNPKKSNGKIPCLIVELGKHQRHNGEVKNNSIRYGKEKILDSLINMNSLLNWLEENQDQFEAETILELSQKMKNLADQVEREEIIFEKFLPIFEKIILEEDDPSLRGQRMKMVIDRFCS